MKSAVFNGSAESTAVSLEDTNYHSVVAVIPKFTPTNSCYFTASTDGTNYYPVEKGGSVYYMVMRANRFQTLDIPTLCGIKFLKIVCESSQTGEIEIVTRPIA